MSPLTHFEPGAPARATHEAEIQVACEHNADAVMEYIDTVLWRLMYPRTVWRAGIGQTAPPNNHLVYATLEAGDDAVDVPADTYQTGTGVTITQTRLEADRKKQFRVAGAINTLASRPPAQYAPRFERFYDGLFGKMPVPTVPRPPPALQPVAPPALPLSGATYAAYIRQHADYGAALVRYYITQRWRAEWWWVTRFWWGTGERINDGTPVTVRTRLDPWEENPNPVRVDVGTGGRVLADAQAQDFVDTPLRLMFDAVVGILVDDSGARRTA